MRLCTSKVWIEHYSNENTPTWNNEMLYSDLEGTNTTCEHSHSLTYQRFSNVFKYLDLQLPIVIETAEFVGKALQINKNWPLTGWNINILGVLTYQVLRPTTNRGHWKSTKQLHLIDTEHAQFTLKLEGLNQSKSIKAENKRSKNWATISDPLITPASPYVGSKLLGPEKTKTIFLNLVKPVVVHHVSLCPSKNHHFCDHALGRKLNSFGPWAQYDLIYAWFEVVSRGPPVTCLFFPLDLMGTVGKETAETNQKKHDSNEKYSNTDIRLLVIPQEYPIPILPYLSWVKSHENPSKSPGSSPRYGSPHLGEQAHLGRQVLSKAQSPTGARLDGDLGMARRDGQEPGYNEGIKAPPSRRYKYIYICIYMYIYMYIYIYTYGDVEMTYVQLLYGH